VNEERHVLNRHAPRRIVLIGLPGCGKSAVGRIVARRLDGPWRFADTDDVIVARDGRPIPQIFAESGEAAFRACERAAIAAETEHGLRVISTGGGAVIDPRNREALWRGALVVFLRARAETLIARLTSPGARDVTSRPLLATGDPERRLLELLEQRTPLYELADWTIQTDALYPDQVAEEIVHVHQRLGEQLVARPERERAWQSESMTPREDSGDPAAWVRATSGSYPVFTGAGELRRLGRRMRDLGLKGRATVVSDSKVAPLYGEQALSALRGEGFDADLVTIPAGEEQKHLATVATVYDKLIDRRAERGDAIVALGGGVTTDLAGFVAASYLRGVPLVQVPTSLLGMVDASIGGKVGVDHARGKNLIGAFYQPRLVVADVDVLTTLSPRDLTEGWAEVIKHALIMDPDLLARMENDAERVLALDPDALTPILRRSAELKAHVVSADEREGGLRMTLNYGHTIGHALESATGYLSVRHGEAVAVGMQGVAQIAVAMGLLDPAIADRQRCVLERYGLPLRWPGVEIEAVLAALAFDKKVAARRQRWVLLRDVGRTEIRDDVPAELVRRVVSELLSA
jgi:3-dehydroquinate synthase